MEAKHTPAPWTFERYEEGIYVRDGSGVLAAECTNGHEELIVKACNNFHKMLQAMKDAHDVLFMPDRGSYEGTAESMHAANAEYAQATLKIAIAKAEEEE